MLLRKGRLFVELTKFAWRIGRTVFKSVADYLTSDMMVALDHYSNDFLTYYLELVLRLPWKVVSVMLVGGRESYMSFATQLLNDFNKMHGESRVCQADLDECIRWIERKRPRK
jgi:hypothetical protein